MAKIIWGKTGEKLFETGVEKAVLYPAVGSIYGKGVAWNGMSAVSENPSGAEATPIYADNGKYVNLISAEDFGCTIEAYMYPDEFAECDGSVEVAPGMFAGQQIRKMFGFTYRTILGNDTELNEHGYKLHLVYGCHAAPSQKTYNTINDSPEASTMSWDVTTTPVQITEKVADKTFKPTSVLIFDSTKFDAKFMAKLEEILYGKDPSSVDVQDGVDPRLPLPDEIIKMVKATGV